MIGAFQLSQLFRGRDDPVLVALVTIGVLVCFGLAWALVYGAYRRKK